MSARDLILRVQLAWVTAIGGVALLLPVQKYIPGGWVAVCVGVLLASSCCVSGDCGGVV